MILPGKVQYSLKAILPRRLQDELVFRWYAGTLTWTIVERLQCPTTTPVGAIRINVVGRDKHGVVKPGDEYQRVCHDIAEAMCMK